MSATPASPSSSALIQTSCTLRRSAISSSRTAWRPSTWRPPSPLARRRRRTAAAAGSATTAAAPATATARRLAARSPGVASTPACRPTCRRLGRRDGLPGVRAATARRERPAHDSTESVRPPLGRPMDQRRGETDDALGAADRAELFGTVALDRDRRADRRGQVALHLVTVRRDLGSFAHDRAVDVRRPPAVLGEHRGDVAQQRHRVGAAPALVGVGEVHPDVAETGRAEQRVGAGMGDDVGVAVALEPDHAVEVAAAEHHHPSGSVLNRWTSNPWPTRSSGTRHDCSSAFGSSSWSTSPVEVVGHGDLAVGGLAVDDDDHARRSPRPARRRRWRRHPWRGRAQHVARNACGVWTATSDDRSGVDTTTPSATTLIVSVTATPGIAASAPSTHGGDRPPEQLERSRAGGRRRGRR